MNKNKRESIGRPHIQQVITSKNHQKTWFQSILHDNTSYGNLYGNKLYWLIMIEEN